MGTPVTEVEICPMGPAAAGDEDAIRPYGLPAADRFAAAQPVRSVAPGAVVARSQSTRSRAVPVRPSLSLPGPART